MCALFSCVSPYVAHAEWIGALGDSRQDVEEQVAKRHIQELLMDKGLLTMLKVWLSPIINEQNPAPGALPAKNLRECACSCSRSLPVLCLCAPVHIALVFQF